MSAERVGVNQQFIVSRGRERLRQHKAPLEIVDIVVEPRRQVLDPQNHP